MHSSDIELFDVVNANDEVIGQEQRSTVHSQQLFHRAVHILLLNKQSELFLQKRSPHKDLHPNVWVTSCSGHVDAGEEYSSAVVRELHEELGIVPPPLQPLFKLNPCIETGFEFVWVYQGCFSGPFQLNSDEISDGQFFSLPKIDEWIQNAPHDFAPSFLTIYKKWKSLNLLQK